MLKWNLKAIVWQLFLSWFFFSSWKKITKILFEDWERQCICSIYYLKSAIPCSKVIIWMGKKLSYIPYVKSVSGTFLRTLCVFHTSQDNKMFTWLRQRLIWAFVFTVPPNLVSMPLELKTFYYDYRTKKIYMVLMYWYQWVTSLNLLAHNTAVYILGYMYSCCTYCTIHCQTSFS